MTGDRELWFQTDVFFSRLRVGRNGAWGWCKPRTVVQTDISCTSTIKIAFVTGMELPNELQDNLWAARDAYRAERVQTLKAIRETVDQ